MRVKQCDKKSKEYAVFISYQMKDVLSAAWELGVSPSTIYRWRRKYPSMKISEKPDNSSASQERQAEIDRNSIAESDSPFFLWCFFL